MTKGEDDAFNEMLLSRLNEAEKTIAFLTKENITSNDQFDELYSENAELKKRIGQQELAMKKFTTMKDKFNRNTASLLQLGRVFGLSLQAKKKQESLGITEIKYASDDKDSYRPSLSLTETNWSNAPGYLQWTLSSNRKKSTKKIEVEEEELDEKGEEEELDEKEEEEEEEGEDGRKTKRRKKSTKKAKKKTPPRKKPTHTNTVKTFVNKFQSAEKILAVPYYQLGEQVAKIMEFINIDEAHTVKLEMAKPSNLGHALNTKAAGPHGKGFYKALHQRSEDEKNNMLPNMQLECPIIENAWTSKSTKKGGRKRKNKE